jgi:hypothetical protein
LTARHAAVTFAQRSEPKFFRNQRSDAFEGIEKGETMTNKRNSYKQRMALLAILCLGALLPVLYVRGEQVADHENKPVFTDPIAGAWNCFIPPVGGAPGFNDIKNIHVGGTQSEIDNAAPPSQEEPDGRYMDQDTAIYVFAKGLPGVLGSQRQFPWPLALRRANDPEPFPK